MLEKSQAIVPAPTPPRTRRWMERPNPFDGITPPPGAAKINLLGVYYLYVQTMDGGDLYVTKFGLPYLEHLKLKNWREDEWFRAHREKLKGTSTVYKVPSKVVNGRSANFVVKWCRVGEDVPLDTMTFNTFSDAEFNSPFEEFSQVIEMRERPVGPVIRTNRPLAIYVPPEQLKLWQTGRSKSKIERKKAKYRDVELDILRQYILLYEWVEGESADEALELVIPNSDHRRSELNRLTERTRADMEENGFYVVDHKPAHVILRHRGESDVLRDRDGDYAYALVDFELLTRTPEYEHEVESARRTLYLEHQRLRFEPREAGPLPEHLHAVNILGVDYIAGRAESTHGLLWVVGCDPQLFDYFIPERWRHTPRERLSRTAETYRTMSKDHVKLVWKVSRVGETPELDSTATPAGDLVAHGFNSPFEEFSIAMELHRKGFSVVYPRAIYRAGLESPRGQQYVTDDSRFASHAGIRTPDGRPILLKEYNYITVWGLWQGRIGATEGAPPPLCSGVNLVQACQDGLISQDVADDLLERMVTRLQVAGFEANLKPTHFLLSKEGDGHLVRSADGMPVITICNFELLRRLPGAPVIG